MRLAHTLWLLVATNVASGQEKPQPLPTVPVTAEAELVRNAKLREFDRRRSSGIGRFLTEADLAKDQYKLLGDVIRRLPGTALVRVKGVRGVSPSALFVVSSRGVGDFNTRVSGVWKELPRGDLA